MGVHQAAGPAPSVQLNLSVHSRKSQSLVCVLAALAAGPWARAIIPVPTHDPRFGVQTHFAQGWIPAWADIAAIRSIPSVRDELYWNAIEQTPGVYQFPADWDTYMGALRDNGMSPLIELDFSNPNYDGGNTPYTDAGVAAYANYCGAVLDHYGSQIQAVEIWNEYNGGSFVSGPATQDLPGTYTKMLKAAYAQIKTRHPDVTVVGGATAGVPLPYWQQLFEDGALSSMDVLSVHPYRYNSPPEGIENDIAALQSLVKQYNNGIGKPIWVTEIGWQVQDGGSGQMAIDEPTQAKFLVRAYALLLSAGVQRVFWYDMHDDSGSTLGLTLPDATPRQSAYAMQVMIGELADAPYVGKEPTVPGLYSMLFRRSDGTQVRVLWSLQPVTLAISGETKVVDMVGDDLGLPGQLYLTDSPVFVEGPMQGLPPAPPTETVLTNSTTDMTGLQGGNGWWFGDFDGSGPFEQLTNYAVTEWTQVWGGAYPYLSITLGDQHPSTDGTNPVSSVRRWVSTVSGTIHVAGQFSCENQGGDGVGVSVLVDGQPGQVRELIGGSNRNTLLSFDFHATVRVGSTVDFIVDPGPALDIDFDATAVSATISQVQ